MSTALDTLDRMTQALTACGQGQLAQSDMIRQWRSGAASLPLPNPFGEVLGNCSTHRSQRLSAKKAARQPKRLMASLQLWADKARARLTAL